MTNDPGTGFGPRELERELELGELVTHYMDRLNDGEHLDSDEILQKHPELGEEVLRQLTFYVDLEATAAGEPPLGMLGDYSLRRPIARGGMGVVYEAWENSIGRTAALKVLPTGIAADSKASTRFMREAQAAGKLSHQNVVSVYSMGVTQKTKTTILGFRGGSGVNKVWNHGLAACLALFVSSAAFAQEYTFTIDGPDSLVFVDCTGSGTEQSAEYTVNLGHAGDGVGAQGWSLGVEVVGGTATSATTDGTNVDDVFNGGFNRTELIDPANNDGREGVVSAVVLCDGCPAVLPSNAVSSILIVGATFTMPEGGGEGGLNVVDGLVGEGQPVDVVVTENGESVDFTAEAKRVALLHGHSCCSSRYNVGFSADSLNNDAAGEGLADDGCACNATGTIGASGETTVYANIASSADSGVQSWSVSIEATGAADITGVTTNGTRAAPEPDGVFSGGFNNTSLANADASGGRRGAVSTVVLCFGCGVTLKPSGTESILAMTVAAPAEGESGQIFFAGGLVGTGEPVDNIITADAGRADVCNFDTAKLTIIGVPGDANYLRGDCNSDGRVDIADPVSLLGELFREGPASTCQAACDSNGDGAVDLGDAVYSIAYLLIGGEAPPAPFPECGPGTLPADAELGCANPPGCQ